MLVSQEKAKKKTEEAIKQASKTSSGSYEQTLYSIDRDHLELAEVKSLNKKKKFEKGYNEDHDCVIISSDGTLGDIYEIQGLRVGIPLMPKDVYKRSKKIEEQYWEIFEVPTFVKKIKSALEFNQYPDEFRNQHKPYIREEFRRRNEGFWFYIKGVPTWLPGSHYVYVQWSKIDIGDPSFREANRIFFMFWEACRADDRCMGMCYLKNRRSGFSFMASSELVNRATFIRNSNFGIMSKEGAAAKEMFTDKVVPISSKYPFFFKPMQSGMDRPKTEIVYGKPSSRLSKNNILDFEDDGLGEGLDTSITHKATKSNSFDGLKLNMFVGDEFGKVLPPENVLKIWDVHKTCLVLGRKIDGKAMIGSTSNALNQGGANFKELYDDSNLITVKRNRQGRTPSGLYSLFINALWNMEGLIDKYGWPVFDTPEEGVIVEDEKGEIIDIGSKEYWQDNVDGLKDYPDRQNEWFRQWPITEKHAFRDEAPSALFNVAKIYEQIDWNEDNARDKIVTKGNFVWKNGIQDSEVIFYPQKDGRFHVTWIPPKEMQNKHYVKNGLKKPSNEAIGAFGCDSYDISGTVDGSGSNGALHGLTGFSMAPNIPSNKFFLEYISRPQTAEIFFEDVLMACVFYGMPILCENNKPRLLYHFRRRGYRGFSMNRPDKVHSQLSKTEKEIGGVPNTSESIKQAHAAAIEAYIEEFVGIKEDEEGNIFHGDVYFNRTLEDWIRFDITKRTKHDASISSGFAIMAVNRLKYKPNMKKENSGFKMPFTKFKYDGATAQAIN